MASGHLKAPRKQAEQIAAPISPAFTVKNPLPTGSRPQMATLYHPGQGSATVSWGRKADYPADFDCFTPGLRTWISEGCGGKVDPNQS